MRISRLLRVATSPKLQSLMAATRPKVYITRNIPPIGRQLLEDGGCAVEQWHSDDAVPRDVLVQNVKGISALFCLLTDKIDASLLDHAGSSLKTVCTMSVGYEHVDVSACHERGVRVGNTPDVLTAATAELTVALLLAVSRRLVEGATAVRSGEWGTWKPMWLCGSGLQGSTVGIVGLGRIGEAVARRLAAFDVAHMLYCTGSATDKKLTAEISGAIVERASFNELLTRSDFVISCCRLTPSTSRMFNASAFARMKPTAIFVNTSRGGVVDQDDLFEALQRGTIRGAGLDVTSPEPLPTDSRLLTLKNCLVLPHIGSATTEARSAMAELTAKNILAVLAGASMPAEVVLPQH